MKNRSNWTRMVSPAALAVFGGLTLASLAPAQVPDLLNTFDPGSPSLGAAGAFDVTNANTFSGFYNPASLGYLRNRTIGAAYRNLPTSSSVISGVFGDPAYTTNTDRGSQRFTHFGYAQPLGTNGNKGTVSLSYTIGGFIEETRFGSNLQLGGVTLSNYAERFKAQSDFYTLAYGKTMGDGSISYGIGLVYATQRIEDRVAGTLSDNSPFNNYNVSDTGSGVGAILGVQLSPRSMPNSSIGLSIRTPISLGNNDDTSGLYDRIPGVVRLGYANRIDNIRANREDYVVFGAQLAHYYSGSGSAPFDRHSQTTFGFGGEYNFSRGSFDIPLRVGYQFIPSGGDGYTDRNTLTLGAGYRPKNANFGVDVAYLIPRHGGNDLAITASYRFDK